MPAGPKSPSAREGRGHWLGVLFVLLAFVWGSQTTGLVSSNDGSHVALARALALRGETRIDPEWALTLRVDVAQRDGHVYSDRPPGTAFAALPAVWIGARLDEPLFETSRVRGRMLVPPGCKPYIYTYAARFEGATPLAAYMGTSLALAFHTVGLGLLALLGLDGLLRRRGLDLRGRMVALAVVGSGTLWGPYATTLFSHGTTVAALTWFLLGLDRLHEEDAPRGWAGLAGLCGAWAIASDYITLLAVVPATLLVARPRSWPVVLLGALPIVAATLAYHQAAFGHPFAIGYQFHGNFEFARDTSTTFDGNPFTGAWTLLGFGHEGAGLLAQSPVALVGIAGWLLAKGRDRRYLLAWLPWLALLCTHHTPWGGATVDHRYLLPLLPLVGLGIGLSWQRWLSGTPALVAATCGLWMISAGLTWSKFLAWHETPAFGNSWVGVGIAAAVGAGWRIAARVRARISRKSP